MYLLPGYMGKTTPETTFLLFTGTFKILKWIIKDSIG